VAYVSHLHLYRHFRVERLRPRNYERRGLVKLRGLIDPVRAAQSAGGRVAAVVSG